MLILQHVLPKGLQRVRDVGFFSGVCQALTASYPTASIKQLPMGATASEWQGLIREDWSRGGH